MNSQEALAQVQQYKELKLHRIIGNTNGFFVFYYEQLRNFKTNSAAFDFVNELHLELFGEYRYASYSSFRTSLERYNRNK